MDEANIDIQRSLALLMRVIVTLVENRANILISRPLESHSPTSRLVAAAAAMGCCLFVFFVRAFGDVSR